MANFFNFYGNYIKAKEYYLLEEINDKLCEENFDLKEKIEFNHTEYKSEFKNFSSILDSKNAEIRALKEEIQSLKDKLQKRDPKTGKFVKKK